MNKWIVSGIIVLIVWACAEEQEPTCETPDKTLVVNGIERSELAFAMRDMYDKMKLVSDSLKSGEEVHANFLELFKNIQTAEGTTPEKIDETYHGMATVFLNTYEEFENNPENKAEAFNNMIESCLVCHSKKCTGPMKTIGKLKVKMNQ